MHLISIVFLLKKNLNSSLKARKMDQSQQKNILQNSGPSALLTTVKDIKNKEITETVIARRSLGKHDNEIHYGILGWDSGIDKKGTR